jgi:hypothetical protein
MKVVVTLVHGTWGRGFLAAYDKCVKRHAPWTEDEALLVRTMRSALGPAVVISRFDWSGRNSHRARLQAARDLATHLTSLVEQYPHAAHAIVAHSHGGNVALYALHMSGLVDRVNGIVSMATPFVILGAHQWTAARLALLKVAKLTPFAFLLALMAAWLALAMYPTLMGLTMTHAAVVGGTAALGGLIVGALSAQAVASRADRLRLEAHAGSVGERLVIVRVPGDEASLVLAASALVERVGHMGIGAFLRFAVPLVLMLIGVVLIVANLGVVAILLFGASSLLGRPELVGGMSFGEYAAHALLLEWGALISASWLAVALAVPMLLAMFVGGAAFGLDAALLSPWLVSRAEESPSGEERIQRFEARRSDELTRGLIAEVWAADVLSIGFLRLFTRVVKDAWRSEALAHTAIHDDPRVVTYVVETVANLTHAG